VVSTQSTTRYRSYVFFFFFFFSGNAPNAESWTDAAVRAKVPIGDKTETAMPMSGM
jgi:hypothetical protein